MKSSLVETITRWVTACICAVLVLSSQSVVGQADSLDLRDERKAELNGLRELVEQQQALINALTERVEALESGQQEAAIAASKAPVVTQAVDTPTKPALRSSVPIELYGFLKLDGAWDSNHGSAGNFARWAPSDDVVEDDSQFSMTARQSRLGMRFGATPDADVQASGRVEVDFYEGGAENKNRVMLRHAYMEMKWPDSGFSIIAGQTSDVISPLVPATVNYPVQWWAGNIGYRRPQVRFTGEFDTGDASKVKLQAALTRTIGDNGPLGNGIDTGQDSGFPTVQGRAAVTFPIMADRMSAVGLSGHWGQEESDGADEDLDTWSVNLDLLLPVADTLTIKSELFHGENLDAYLGGVAQGVTYAAVVGGFDGQEVASSGGWLSLEIGPFGKWKFSLGTSLDDPDDDDLPVGARSRNSSVWGNFMYKMNRSLSTGLEISYYDTEYKGLADGSNFRVQTALYFRF